MAIQTVPFTREGYSRLKEELDHLKSTERSKIIREIADARAHGDLDDKLSRAQVIEFGEHEDLSKVKFGAFVTVSDEESGENKTYRIVGELEADLDRGLISMSSPIARALLGKSQGDLIEVRAPKGPMEYTIKEVRAR